MARLSTVTSNANHPAYLAGFQDGSENLWLWNCSVNSEMPSYVVLLFASSGLQRAVKLLTSTIWHWLGGGSDGVVLRRVNFWDCTCWEHNPETPVDLPLSPGETAWLAVCMDVSEAFVKHKQVFQSILKQC